MSSSKTYRILHIEDAPGDVRLVDIYLNESEAVTIKERLDFDLKLTNVTSMREAHDLEEKENYDVALLDLSLPDTFGIESLVKFKEAFPECPTIVLTGTENKKVGIEALAAGADDYLVKGRSLDSYILLKSIYYARIRKDNKDLIQQKEIAEETAKVKQEILANMSHELRTPLNVVINIASLLQDVEDVNTRDEYVNTLIISSKNLRILINNTLDLMKGESGNIELELRPFTPTVLLNDLMDMYKYKAREKGVGLYPKFDPFLPKSVIGDSNKLNQVFINLLDNALKFTDQGEIEIGARVVEEKQHEVKIAFSVKDTGIGIPPEKLKHIFESFVQANQSTTRLYGGTGLGLSISQHIIKLHGSEIMVDSEPGKGATFSFVLDMGKTLAPLPKEATPKPKEAMSLTAAKDVLDKSISILLVEDHPPNQMIARQLLKRWSSNIALDIADNGKIAVDKVNQNTYDIILMDVSMPVMDGFEATREIRKLPSPKGNIPIVAMTAHALDSKKEECFEAGMNAFISKPIEPSLMYDTINKYIGKSGAVSISETNALSEKGPRSSVSDSKGLEISYTYFDHLAGDDVAFKKELIQSFAVDIDVELEKLKVAFNEKQDFITYYNIAHKLKTSFSYLGLKENKLVKEMLWRPEVETPDVKIESKDFDVFFVFAQKVLEQVNIYLA